MKILTIILSFYIFVLSLAPNMQGGEYFKVTKLVSHYLEHQSGQKVYQDFIDFINDHYLNGQHHEKEHKNLPFKSQTSAQISVADLRIPTVNFIVEEIDFKVPTKVSFPERSIYSESDLGPIWNPPRCS